MGLAWSARAKGTYPSAVGRAVVHDDIGPAILASIPFDLEIIRTYMPKARGPMLRDHAKRKIKIQKMGGKERVLQRMPGEITSIFGPRPISMIGFVFTKSM